MDISVKITYRNDKLKTVRRAVGLSQSQVAEKTGISIRMIQNYEQGVKDLNGAKLATILKICAALQCKIVDILTDTETIDLLKGYEATPRGT
jgi:transcriptional regulator with XRE-family HTH domain